MTSMTTSTYLVVGLCSHLYLTSDMKIIEACLVFSGVLLGYCPSYLYLGDEHGG